MQPIKKQLKVNSSKKNEKIVYGFQSEREANFPPLVQLALMHYICNSRCKKCPVGLYERGEIGQDNSGEFDPKKRTFFPMNIFTKIADEIGNYPWSILRFHGRGEPLLHPNYIEMIEYAKKAGVGTVTSFTNAILLDEKKTEQILNSGLDLLELSIDAYTEDLYRTFRGTNYFKQVVKNAENFIRARNERGKKTETKVIVSAVDCPEFQPEKQAFKEYWSTKADEVIFRPYHTYGGRLPTIVNYQSNIVVPCSQLWTRFSVNPWGKVNACFNDWADLEIVGDLNKSTIAQIWRGNIFEAIREKNLKANSSLTCCSNCLASKSGWIYTYQGLIEKLKSPPIGQKDTVPQNNGGR
jgi:hypothetical protein